MPKRDKGKWVLLLPCLFLVAGVALVNRTQNRGRVEFERARQQWRAANYRTAVARFESLLRSYPQGRFVQDALWEVATISYLNLYDIDLARRYYLRLVEEYPDGPWAARAHLRLAEILELEINDLTTAIDHWEQALKGNLDPEVESQIRLKMADGHFRLNDVETSLSQLRQLIETGPTESSQRARLRIATILQMRQEYEESNQMFEQVLRGQACTDCRLEAQLGLIENYELLDQLPRAVSLAQTIRSDSYPEPMRQALLERLMRKQRSFEPKLWTGR